MNTPNERRRAILQISEPFWWEFPEIRAYIGRTFVMIHFEYLPLADRFEALLEHPDFPEVKEGTPWPVMEISITRVEGQPDVIEWEVPDPEKKKRDFREWIDNQLKHKP